jgi:hypothetical protein
MFVSPAKADLRTFISPEVGDEAARSLPITWPSFSSHRSGYGCVLKSVHGLAERSGDIGNHVHRRQRVAGAVEVFIRKIEDEHSKNDGHGESHDGIITDIA